MLRLAPVLAIVLIITGCDPAVEARYQPTTVDEVYGPLSHVSGVDEEVHQLPAPPPALDASEAPPRVCRPPGVVLKPIDIVGLRDDTPRPRRLEPTPLVAMYEPPMPSPPPGPAHRIASWNQHREIGVKEPIATPIEPSTVQAGTSLYRVEPARYGAYRRDIYAWCNDAANLR